jgi:DNA end-binding protein Ku
MARKRAAKKSTKKRKAAWRASWKGQLRFGLVSLGVEAVNARSREEGDIHFHQLHAKCHNRIHYEKVCPVHGEVDNDEIVSGFEYSRGKYVEIEPEEIDALRTDAEKSLTIDSFVAPESVDLLYLDGRMYYLLPSGAESNEPYQVLATSLQQEQVYGVGHIVMSGKDQIVLVRSHDGLLQMAMLNYAAELRPEEDFAVPHEKVSPKKLKLAKDLIHSWSDENFDFEHYEDQYRHRLAELIDAKVSGKETVEPAEEEEGPVVINLMDALKKSVSATRRRPTKNKAKTRTSRRRTTKRKRA